MTTDPFDDQHLPRYAQPAAQAPQYAVPPPPPQGGYSAPPQGGYAAAPQGQYPYAAPTGARTNVLALISMIASILGLVWMLPVVGSIVGVVLGHMARKQIAQTGEQGAGMATAGLVIGYIGLGLFVAGVALYIGIFALSFAAA